MKVFLSYSSKEQNLAEQICLALEQSGHSVFFDKKSLRVSDSFRKKIRKELDRSEVFVFLISPASVAPKSYARSELEIAREKWPQPSGHILPVMAIPTDLESVPPYLKAVTILDPEGEIVEAVSRSLDHWSPMQELDAVEDARRIIEQSGLPSDGLVADTFTTLIDIASFVKEVLLNGTPMTTYRRQIMGRFDAGQLVQEPTDYTASAGRDYQDDQGRTCREITISHRSDGKLISHQHVFYLHRGNWQPLPNEQ